MTRLLLLAALLSAPVVHAEDLQPFVATYQVFHAGRQLGEATMQVVRLDGARWRVDLGMQGQGLMRITGLNLQQSTLFDSSGASLRPLSQSTVKRAFLSSRKTVGIYDWNARSARWTGDVKKTRTAPVALQDGDMSGLLIDLAVIRDAIEAVHGHTSYRIDYTSSTAGDDEAAKELFRTGKTMGVFYTESPASRLLCAKSRADTFELLVLNTSMIRPASNKYIQLYLERLRNGTPYEPLDPCLRNTLEESFGIMVYQEDVVNVCATFAGMSPATGDGLRKALSKKRPAKHLGAYAEEFFTGAMRLGRDPDAAKRVWEMIMSFAGYSFCKGHSCSYIQVAQHACALRAHHPAEFMAAVLSNGGGFYQPFAYVAEAMRMGLTVLPPDINASDFRCSGKGREIRIGLQFIKGLSADAVERVFAELPG